MIDKNEKTILAIDTSCDETSVAITRGRRVMANVIYSQILIHKKWGGVVPSLAKRAHEERIDLVVDEALGKIGGGTDTLEKKIDAIAVTQGPGLAIALEVGMKKAKQLSLTYKKPIIAVNHLEGHIYSPFVQNSKGNPARVPEFPMLAVVVSGGHTELVYLEKDLSYVILGETVDDAAGEALDKAAKMLGLGYPGGPVIETLSRNAMDMDYYHFPRPMIKNQDLMFSFSGLKTALYYFLKKMSPEETAGHIGEIASSFQAAVFDTLIIKTRRALKANRVKCLSVGGGVAANRNLRDRMRNIAKEFGIPAYFPPYKYLNGDNAAMIGLVAGLKEKRKMYVSEIEAFDRIPRYPLPKHSL